MEDILTKLNTIDSSLNKVALNCMYQLDRFPDFHGIWHRLTTEQRENIINSLVKIMKAK